MNSWTMKVGGVVLMALMASTVWGRLGESPEQCDKRYGLDYTQKGPDNFWSFSRDYKKSGIRVSIRFLKFTSGVIVAGWIAYETDYTVKEPGELRNRIREAISDSWSSLDEGKPTPICRLQRLNS